MSADLGGEDAFRDMVAAFRRHGLGVIVDIVPNHMAIGAPESLNRQFWSVLRDGAGSPFAHWFDIDWPAGGGRLLLPILAGPPATAWATSRWTPARRTGRCCATTSTCCRCARAPRTCRWPDLAGCPALPAGGLAGRRHRAELAAVLRRHLADRGPGRGRGRVRRHPRPAAAAWWPRGSSTACGSTTPTGSPIRAATWTGWPRRPAAPGWSPRRSSPARRNCRRTGGARAPPATTRSRMVGGLFLDPAGAAPLDRRVCRVHRGHQGLRRRGARRAKREVATGSLSAEVRRLARLLARAADPALRGLDGGDLAHRPGRTAHRVRRLPGVRGARRAAAGRLRRRRGGRGGRRAADRLPARLRPALAAVAAARARRRGPSGARGRTSSRCDSSRPAAR